MRIRAVRRILIFCDTLFQFSRRATAAGFPYAGTYIGPQAIFNNVHQRLGTEWQGYRADVDHFYDAGENVIAQGFYHGTYGATGKSFTASFAHIYQLRAGKIIKFVQIVDSAKVLEAMQG